MRQGRFKRKTGYQYSRPVKRSRYSIFRRQALITLIFIGAFSAVGYYIYSGLHHSAAKTAISSVENEEITGNKQTFTSDLFEFQDTGTWIIDKNNTSAAKVVYDKYRKNQLQAVLTVYINQAPIPLYLAAPLVLPVRIINNSSLQATDVSRPCVSQYGKTDLHRPKEVSINNATILCDPDSSEYYIVLSEISGNYQLRLKRPNGTPVQFVITYKDDGLAPQPTSVINIASSFHTK